KSMPALGGPQEMLLLDFVVASPVRVFLAIDTESRPRHSLQPFLTDFLFALEANPVATVRDPIQRSPDVAQERRFPLEIASRQFARGGQLYFVQRVGCAFDRKTLAPPESSRRFDLFRPQHD